MAKVKTSAKITAFITRRLLSLRYSVSITNIDLIKSDKTKLFLPNHKAIIDPLLIGSQLIKYKLVSTAVSDAYYNNPIFKPILDIVESIPVSDIEAGNRDPKVLDTIISEMVKALEKGNDIMIYPAGQISSTPNEIIKNKQSVHKLIPILPAEVLVIGLRVTGFWGSMWSKAYSKKTPDFLKTFLKGIGILFLNLIFFAKRRKINLEFVDLTKEIKEKAKLERKDFNQFLEEFYNSTGDEKLTKVRYWIL